MEQQEKFRKDGNASPPKQPVSFEEHLMSQVVQQEALTGLPVEKEIFNKEELWEMPKMANGEMKGSGV